MIDKAIVARASEAPETALFVGKQQSRAALLLVVPRDRVASLDPAASLDESDSLGTSRKDVADR
jgi:hypothetical protein